MYYCGQYLRRNQQIIPFAMRRLLLSSLISLAGLLGCTSSHLPTTGTPEPHVDIMLVGSPHFSQLYNAKNPLSDVLSPQRQAELATLNDRLQRFQPDAILVEELPEQQAYVDSLYQRYRQGQLTLTSLPNSRSEIYQVAFVLGKRLGHEHIYCVNAPGGTSQSILHEGTNIELYQQATQQHRDAQAPILEQFQKGTLTMAGLLAFVNSPALLQQLHTLVYRTPARVTNGTLKPDPMVDAAFINPNYVGAEFISVFYNRDLKVYSNIVTTQLATGNSRLLTIIGARHVASLQGILSTDPAYRVIAPTKYLK